MLPVPDRAITASRRTPIDEKDSFRFIHDLYEFNDKNPAPNIYYREPYEVGLRKREILVEILAFCMMPNHFHLMLRQVGENGITEFMRKLGTGYTNYFNQKYERSGSLFQGKYKLVMMEKESQFINLPHYIHLNPLKLIFPKWKENGVKDVAKAINFLEEYRWSSFQDFVGKKNFPSLLCKTFMGEYKVNLDDYRKLLTKSD